MLSHYRAAVGQKSTRARPCVQPRPCGWRRPLGVAPIRAGNFSAG